MLAEPLPIRRPLFNFGRETLMENDIRIINEPKILVKVALPLLVPAGEQLVKVGRHVLIHVFKIIICLPFEKY